MHFPAGTFLSAKKTCRIQPLRSRGRGFISPTDFFHNNYGFGPGFEMWSVPNPVFKLGSDPDPVFKIWSDLESVFKTWTDPDPGLKT